MISLAGDCHQLLDYVVIERTGLVSIVRQTTRGSSYLDSIYTSNSSYQSIILVHSSVRSDHQYVVAYSGDPVKCYAKNRRICSYRPRPRTPDLKAAFVSN